MITAVKIVRQNHSLSIRRLAHATDEPVSSVARWVKPRALPAPAPRPCPVSGEPDLQAKVRQLCLQERYQTCGYRRIHALLRRDLGITVNRKTVLRIMHQLKLTRPKIWHRPYRPKRIEKMHPERPNQGWQIDMTSFRLANGATLYLVVVIDCCSRKIVGWTLSRRARADEWAAAVRMGMEAEEISSSEQISQLVIRSDNGAQPCSRKFTEFVASRGVKNQYTGYDAPDDNGFVERVIRTIKEEEIWINNYEDFNQAHKAVDHYVQYYNQQRIHSAIGYLTPNEFAAKVWTLIAA